MVGPVVVWNQSFEKMCNRELGEMLPRHADFFEKVNENIFDLRKIFSDHLFVHPGFRGSTSIKDVLPVLCPLHSYSSLSIAAGTSAAINWYHLATRRHPEDHCTRIHNDLLKYCELDSMAMLKIYEVLAAI